jgi:hypothetical protein
LTANVALRGAIEEFKEKLPWLAHPRITQVRIFPFRIEEGDLLNLLTSHFNNRNNMTLCCDGMNLSSRI